jgi:hypothetical protein
VQTATEDPSADSDRGSKCRQRQRIQVQTATEDPSADSDRVSDSADSDRGSKCRQRQSE